MRSDPGLAGRGLTLNLTPSLGSAQQGLDLDRQRGHGSQSLLGVSTSPNPLIFNT